MKLSVILVSVNLAASLPILTASAVWAQESANTGTGEWLKSSLASLDTSVNQKKNAHTRKALLPQPAADTSGPVVLHSNGVRLRPFVPNRKLPSQHDLDLQFIAQTAKMAQPSDPPPLTAQTPMMAPSPLNGSITQSNFGSQSGIDNYGSTGYIRQSSGRVVPAQIVATPGQVRRLHSSKRERFATPPSMQAQDALENDSDNDQIAPSQFAGSQYQQRQMMSPQPAAQMSMQQAQIPTQFQPISAEEQTIIDRMVNSPHTNFFEHDAVGEQPGPAANAGPPPFPLNLLPADSLKSVIGGSMRRPRIPTQPSYFGSWRGNTPLQPAGFQTYAPRLAQAHTVASSPSPIHRPNASRQVKGLAPRTAASSNSSLSQLRRLAPQESRVESYPPYLRLSTVNY